MSEPRWMLGDHCETRRLTVWMRMPAWFAWIFLRVKGYKGPMDLFKGCFATCGVLGPETPDYMKNAGGSIRVDGVDYPLGSTSDGEVKP